MADEPTIKPIQTAYKGFRFRSRLEARQAVFLDALGVRWEYEKEGFDLGKIGWYLPDFYLPDLDCWLEVKGSPIAAYGDEWSKARELALQTEQYVYVFMGQFSSANQYFGLRFVGTEDERSGDQPRRRWWFQCPVCKEWQLGMTAHELPCDCLLLSPADQPVLVEAILKAKQARFEHGERP